jgi:eukaryotic-like serine/threonine-protein kinase
MQPLNIGHKLQNNRYEIIEIISNNTGFGITYKAIDHNLPTKPICVIKQLKDITNPKYLDLFKKEAEALEILGQKYDQIPTLFEYFILNNQPFYVQEYIEGISLSQELYQQLQVSQKLSESQVISLLIEILEILEYIQSNPQHPVIHRDIKPANIIRRKSDQKLVFIDFGLVKEILTEGTQTASFFGGTPGYIAPEIGLQRKVSFASDIYSVGVIGVFAITGENPSFTNNLDEEWQQKVQVSREFATVLNKMICHDYKQRYQTATEAKKALQKLNETIISPLPIKLIALIVISLSIFGGALFALKSSNSNLLQFNGKENKGELTKSDSKELALATLKFYDTYSFKGKQGLHSDLAPTHKIALK